MKIRSYVDWITIIAILMPLAVPHSSRADDSLGAVLDAPELAFTLTGSPPFASSPVESSPRITGSLGVGSDTSYESGITTQLTGPGKLYFSTRSVSGPEDHWRATVNGAVVEFPQTARGFWERFSVSIPVGPATVEITARNLPAFISGPGAEAGQNFIDDVTFCSAAGTLLKNAIEVAPELEMWLRQSSRSLWIRSTAVSHDGVDSLTLAAAQLPRNADLVIANNGAILGGTWIKAEPGMELLASSSAIAHRFTAGVDGEWIWKPFALGSNAPDLRLSVDPAGDVGGAVFVDGFNLYKTSVPMDQALDTPGRAWAGDGGSGNHSLALPGSDAVGEKAVLLSRSSISTAVSGTFKLKYRYRFCDSPGSNDASVWMGNYITELGTTDEPWPEDISWKEREHTAFNLPAGTRLEFHSSYGSLLLDRVEIIPLGPVDLADALDAPAFVPGAPTGWTGLAGIGYDGADAAFSPASPSANAHYGGGIASDRLVYNNPWPNGSIDAGFWWNKESGGGQMSFVATGLPDAFGRWVGPEYATFFQNYYGAGWQNLRLHYDRAPASVDWRLTTWHPFAVVPAGNSQVDKFTWLSGAENSFSKALDTDEAGSVIAMSGWNAVGDAIASVQNSVTWQDGDALEIRAAGDGKATQRTVVTAQFQSNTDFSCRVKRGSHPDCSLALLVDSISTIPVPLTEVWTEFRLLLPVVHPGETRPIAFDVSVVSGAPDAVVYLDAVSLKPATDFNVALETNGLTWNSGGSGQRILRGWNLGTYNSTPDYTGYVDGVEFSGLEAGQQSWMETTVAGPGTVVFAGFIPDRYRSNDSVSLQVNGVARDTLERGIYGSFRLQASVAQGVHAVRWLVSKTAPGAPSSQLHSVAFVPGAPETHLASALESLSPDQTWIPGGGRSPEPLYGLMEGATSFAGIFFPALAAGESSWLETPLDGPAKAEFFWQSATQAFCHVDGRKAARSVREPFDSVAGPPRVVLDLPSGSHTVRWEGGAATAELRGFSTIPGSEIASFLAGVATPPLVWNGLNGPWAGFLPWQVVDDDPFWTYDGDGNPIEVPGTGLPVLTGNDQAVGGFWITGPAVLSLEVRGDDYSSLSIGVDQGSFDIFHSPGFTWQPAGVVIPAGEHEITFRVEEEDDDSESYAWLRNFHISPGAAYPDWAAGFGLGLAGSGPSADPDGDGQENLLEFAFATDPTAGSGAAMPELTGTPPNISLRFPSLPYDATGLSYEVQISGDLQTWSTIATVPPDAAGESGPVVQLPSSPTSKQFVRVQVHLSPPAG